MNAWYFLSNRIANNIYTIVMACNWLLISSSCKRWWLLKITMYFNIRSIIFLYMSNLLRKSFFMFQVTCCSCYYVYYNMILRILKDIIKHKVACTVGKQYRRENSLESEGAPTGYVALLISQNTLSQHL